MEPRSVRQLHPVTELKEVQARLDDLQGSIERLCIGNPSPLQARLRLDLATIRRAVTASR
jgi:hypothetical protein